MAGASLLALIDDITTLLDDVAGMTKVAAGKTAGVVGDDLALNANQVSGTPADRELPVVWAVAKGSMINKAILIPAAILLSAFLPFLVLPLLMLGGLYLCYEGSEKLLHGKKHDAHDNTAPLDEAAKIKGAIRTDFILSAEITIIALGIVAEEALLNRITVLTLIGVGMTVIVYGLVAAIVKLDDAGLYLSRKTGMAQKTGFLILRTAPYLMRTLSVVGTAAMFMVGGQIILHGIHPLYEALGQWGHGLVGAAIAGVFGLACGMVVVFGEKGVRTLLRR